jgi:hypothetical protein
MERIFSQRPILNFTPRRKLWPHGQGCPPGVNFVPRGWSYPLGVKFSVRPSILLNSIECSPLGWTKGWSFPLGDIVHPWGPGLKLRMALRFMDWSQPTFQSTIPTCRMYLRMQLHTCVHIFLFLSAKEILLQRSSMCIEMTCERIEVK